MMNVPTAMEAYNKILVSSALALVAEKIQEFEAATIRANDANAVVEKAQQKVLTSEAIKKAEETLREAQRKNEEEISDLQIQMAEQQKQAEYNWRQQQQNRPGNASSHPPIFNIRIGRDVEKRHRGLLQQCMNDLDAAKAAAFASEEFQAVARLAVEANRVLAETKKARDEAANFVNIFTCICDLASQEFSKQNEKEKEKGAFGKIFKW